MQKFFYHVTPTSNVGNILKRGLIPSIPVDFEDVKAVYLFYTIDDASNALMNWMGERDIYEDVWDFTLLRIDSAGIYEIDEDAAAPYELVVTSAIPPRYITVEQHNF